MVDIETDILIVGAGIAGSALACALRRSGMTVTLLDKSDKPLDTARGDHLQPRTCEILESWGVLDDFFAAGAEKRAGALWLSPEGDEILRSSVAQLQIPHPYFAFLNHESIADVLLASALQTEHVRVIRPIRNVWLANDDGRFYTFKVGLPSGDDLQVRARVVVGADGRVSRVRKTFDMPATTHSYKHGIAVFLARQRSENPDNYLHVYLGKSIMSVIPRTGGGCKIGIPMQHADAAKWRGAKPDEFSLELQQRAPALDVDDLQFADIYAPVFLRAENWAQDGVVLCGDSCHAMHPARSQGMNIAIRCIDVLAKELSALDNQPDRAAVRGALRRYERSVRKPTEALLAGNHARALEMDNPSAATQAKLARRLRLINDDVDMQQQYALLASGYAPS